MIITIDGPAGSGKSTAARRLAKRLGFSFLDTGAMYRAVTLRALRDNVPLTDQSALEKCAREAELKLGYAEGELKVWLDGRDVTREIRLPEVTDNAHYIASAGPVRSVLVEQQRRIGRSLGNFVTEGRDQGSVVFPQAEVKFYLDADSEVRARRRYEELLAQGESASLEEIHRAIVERDGRDQQREVSPLVKPEGAIVIDTSELTIDQMVDALASYAEGGR